eukprot:scaffold2262_cov107-Skeletonema_dohrnii-CCMP3373.AAC.5
MARHKQASKEQERENSGSARFVQNSKLRNGLKAIWDNFLAGNEIEHVEVKEEGEQGTITMNPEKKNGRMPRMEGNNMQLTEMKEMTMATSCEVKQLLLNTTQAQADCGFTHQIGVLTHHGVLTISFIIRSEFSIKDEWFALL